MIASQRPRHSRIPCASGFPDSTQAVENRIIHFQQAVSVRVSVNCEPVTLRYRLDGFSWRPSEGGTDYADKKGRGWPFDARSAWQTRSGSGPGHINNMRACPAAMMTDDSMSKAPLHHRGNARRLGLWLYAPSGRPWAVVENAMPCVTSLSSRHEADPPDRPAVRRGRIELQPRPRSNQPWRSLAYI